MHTNGNKLYKFTFALTLCKEGSSVKHIYVPTCNGEPLTHLFYCRQVIEYSSSGEWFHRTCERVKDGNYNENNTDDWLCSKCLPDL